MRIAVFGATGQAGRRVVTEGRERGHEVTALSSREIDATDAAAVTDALRGHSVGIGATRAPAGQEPLAEQMTRVLLDAHAATRTRFVMIGGAGVLVGPDSTSYLSMEDLAVALLDEIERPRFRRRRFTARTRGRQNHIP